jgi:hypothetical protein
MATPPSSRRVALAQPTAVRAPGTLFQRPTPYAYDEMLEVMRSSVLDFLKPSSHKTTKTIELSSKILYYIGALIASHVAHHFGVRISLATNYTRTVEVTVTSSLTNFLGMLGKDDLATLSRPEWQSLATVIADAWRIPVPADFRLLPVTLIPRERWLRQGRKMF